MKDYNTIRSAAISAHNGQLYGGKPYSYHLEQVVEVARKFMNCLKTENSPLILAICYCHDLMEDCRFTYNDILELTGEKDIAEAVRAVTSDIRGRNREARMSDEVYNDIHKTPYACFVKLADRIANVEHSLSENNRMFNMYKKEHSKFSARLRSHLELEPMWKHLEYLFQFSINEYITT